MLLHIDGEIEESAFPWVESEVGRPINWRELWCLVKLVKQWGHRLAGCHLDLETDNIVSYQVLGKLRAIDSHLMELVRRFYALLEQHHITFSIRHTPGVDLLRPDALSRRLGDLPLPPRQAIKPEFMQPYLDALGQVTHSLGAEISQHTRAPLEQLQQWEGKAVIFMHPRHSHITQALSMLWRRARCAPSRTQAMVVLPAREEAKWWSLTKGLTHVIRWPAGSPLLRQWEGGRVGGGWVDTSPQHDTILMVYPPSVGMAIPAQQAPMIRAGDFLWRPVAANEGELSPTQDWHSNSILFRAVADLEPGDEHVCVSEVVKWSWPTRVDRRTTTFLQSAPFGHHRASSWDQGDPWWVRPHSCLLLGALGQQWIKAHPSASNPTESRTVSRVVLDLIALNAATVRYAAQNQITRFGEAESPLPAPAQPVQQVALSGPGTVTRSHTQGKPAAPPRSW